MDGTALYEAVAAIYIAQCYGKDLSLGEVILVRYTNIVINKDPHTEVDNTVTTINLA